MKRSPSAINSNLRWLQACILLEALMALPLDLPYGHTSGDLLFAGENSEILVHAPNPNACPVSANLSPKAVKEQNVIKHIFSNGAIARRIGLTLLHERKNEAVKVKFLWIPLDHRWSNVSGEFLVKPDGNPNCFFLGHYAGIPENVEAGEFHLEAPSNIQVKKITFSSLPSEKAMNQCPMPGLEEEIDTAYASCLENPDDRGEALRFVRLLEKSMYRYDCRRDYDFEPVPAWWLADNAEKWFVLLWKSDIQEAKKLFISKLFRDTLDGAIAEMFLPLSQEIEYELDDAKLNGTTEKNRNSEFTTPSLRFDGIYQSYIIEYSLWDYIRFYGDGTVVTSYSEGSPNELYRLLEKENIGSRKSIFNGHYKLSGDRLTFSSKSAGGVIDYEGKILKNGLILDVQDPSRPEKATCKYRFSQLSGE